MATTKSKQPKKVAGANPYGATTVSGLAESVGNIDRSDKANAVKTSGIKIRGTGAATKGTMARGPMA